MFVLSTARRYTPSRYNAWEKDARPIVLMRQATLEEWMGWRQIQLEIEERRRTRHEARLAQIGISAEEYQKALELQLSKIEALAQEIDDLQNNKQEIASTEEVEDSEAQAEVPEAQAETPEALIEVNVEETALALIDDKAREHLEAYQRTFNPELDIERMSELEHGIQLLERVITGFERVSLPDGTPLPWDVNELKALGLERRQVLMSLAGPGIEGLTTLVEMTNFAVQGLAPEEKKDCTAT